MTLRLAELTPENLPAAVNMPLEPGDEARRRGVDRITVLWEPGDDGPEGFYLRLGFEPTGEELFGEVVDARAV